MPRKYQPRYRRRRRIVRRQPVNNSWSRGFVRGYAALAKYTNWDTVSKALNDIKGLINSEMYKFDVVDSGTTVTNAGTYTSHLTAVAQGDGDSARTGNSIFVRNLRIRGQIIFSPTGGDIQNVTIMLVLDTQQIADTTSVNAALVLAAQNVDSPLNPQNVGRFSILYRRKFTLWSPDRLQSNFLINKVLRHHVRYNGTTGGDIQKGGLYLIAISDQGANGPAISHYSRLSYHDN